jgi:hypothetical protein
MKRLFFPLLLTAAVLAAGTPRALGRETPQRNARRIVAIGDVHGAAAEFTAILQKAGLVNQARRWTGGSTVFVQTGDITDRGTGMRDALDLLMALEREASRAGGRVHPLLGNHEVMNMLGQLRDATPEIFATFGGEAEMRAAFGPKGRYGRWLRERQAIATVDGTLFMHAGIDPAATRESIDELNRRVRRDIEAWDKGVELLVEKKLVAAPAAFLDAVTAARTEIERLNAAAAAGDIPEDAPRVASLLLPVANIGTSSLLHPQGPMWFRGFAAWTDEEAAVQFAELSKRYNVRRFVSGHTAQADGRIRERLDGSVFLIDTGMLGGRYFPGGRPSALELTADAARQIYLQ